MLSAIHERGIPVEERADAVGCLRGRRAFTVQTPGQVLDRILWDRSRELPPVTRERASVEQRPSANKLFGFHTYGSGLIIPICHSMKMNLSAMPCWSWSLVEPMPWPAW